MYDPERRAERTHSHATLEVTVSTRGLIGWRVDGQDKLTRTTSSAYPEWLGPQLYGQVKRLRARMNPKELRAAVRSIEMVEDKSLPTANHIDRFLRLAERAHIWTAGMDTSSMRMLIAPIRGNLEFMLDFGVMTDDTAYALRGGWCQWGYIFDLDAGTLEIYAGYFARGCATGRFRDIAAARAAALGASPAEANDAEEPISHILTLPLDDMPTDWERLTRCAVTLLRDPGDRSVPMSGHECAQAMSLLRRYGTNQPADTSRRSPRGQISSAP